jgi:hypothetical protein
MHSLYLVSIDKNSLGSDTSPEGIMRTVSNILDDNNFANTDHGYYGNCKCDGYEIGGRWSGMLQAWSKGIDLDKEIEEKISGTVEVGGDIAEKLQKLWEDLGGVGENPQLRGGGVHDDDVVLIGQKEWLGICMTVIPNKDLSGELKVAIIKDGNIESEGILDHIEYEEIKDTWLVAINYHS